MAALVLTPSQFIVHPGSTSPTHGEKHAKTSGDGAVRRGDSNVTVADHR